MIALLLAVSVVFAVPRLGSFSVFGPPQTTTIMFYVQGRRDVISPHDPDFSRILALSQSIYTHADNGLLLAVSQSLVDQIRNHETAVEILYATPVQLLASQAPVRRLLIVTHGSHERLILYGTDNVYDPGPFLSGDTIALSAVESIAKSAAITEH
jgi:hypothetical protein